jgi:hypothetical protein
MTLLYGILPPLMAWKLRAQHAQREGTAAPMSSSGEGGGPALFVPGGAPVLAGLICIFTGFEVTRWSGWGGRLGGYV